MAQQFLAKIRETDCIGCTKCLDVCPTDAILGSDGLMHTVITSECIGCKLCIPPCPVDCIELERVSATYARIPPDYVKRRYQNKQQRLNAASRESLTPLSLEQRKQYIADAMTRSLNKKRPASPA